ncbi:hypothetical protein PPYR_05014 [Photinus pyralis]|uniref:Uncharacterized protein n=2 Tax=Photinus pyralis TaxID=7054 RepID=A0A5N4AZY8_PHOPY|nr:uncharacterized protein LOC116164911 isoform X1 [Photinus pyralis]KAB0802828.1 hypothetical protein PPYR_05014 [Photinus pyralis]
MDELKVPLNSKLSAPIVYNAKNQRKKQALSVTDTVLSLVLVSPLTIGCWRGTWELVTCYTTLFPAWLTFLFGNVAYAILIVGKYEIGELITTKSTTLEFTLKRLHTYVFMWIGICIWNRGWELYNLACEIKVVDIQELDGNDNPYSVIGSFVFFYTCLGCLRSTRSTLNVPFVMVLDTKSAYSDFPTRFKKTIEEKTTLYVLDCLFSVFIIGTLVVFVWRGAWVLVDIYLFPENEYWSAWGSLVLGYTIVAIAFLLQPMMRWICDRISGLLRLLVADVFLFFSFVGTVNVWRGIWNLLNLYFLPENMELSAWITHWVCLILLILLKCSNTLLVRGVYIDADEPAGKCVVFPVYYLRLIFQRERIKKINKKFQIEAMSRRKIELDNIKIDCSCGTDLKNHITKENAQNHSPSQ